MGNINMVRQNNGVFTSDTSEIKTSIESHFGEVFNAKLYPPTDAEILEPHVGPVGNSPPMISDINNADLTKLVTMDELTSTLKLLKNNKAPGVDGVRNEL